METKLVALFKDYDWSLEYIQMQKKCICLQTICILLCLVPVTKRNLWDHCHHIVTSFCPLHHHYLKELAIWFTRAKVYNKNWLEQIGKVQQKTALWGSTPSQEQERTWSSVCTCSWVRPVPCSSILAITQTVSQFICGAEMCHNAQIHKHQRQRCTNIALALMTNFVWAAMICAWNKSTLGPSVALHWGSTHPQCCKRLGLAQSAGHCRTIYPSDQHLRSQSIRQWSAQNILQAL